MVKGRTGQRVRLYVRGSILGFKSYSQACAWPFSWIGRRWLKEDAAAIARSSPVPPADTVAAWYPPTVGSRPRRRRGVQYYSSASISIARTDILNVSRSASSMELATGAMELATGFCLPRRVLPPRLCVGPPALRLCATPCHHLCAWVPPL
ncbi:hypothetical protein ZWY2020_053052 [Hordeum vulgare]|nr:hypothetical protein ZWY2020_053052 [Hordeum vulgare]